jgi:hypothetical protein
MDFGINEKYIHMKTLIRNIIIIISPFLFMMFINEFVRHTIKDKPFVKHGITAMNSSIITKEKCTWNCHNDTYYCKKHHTKLLKPFEKKIDIVYFKIICLLRSTGNYGMANIIFLVILWPFTMYVLLIKALDMKRKMNQIKNRDGRII